MGNPCNALGKTRLARVCVEMALTGGKGKSGLEGAGLGESVSTVHVRGDDDMDQGSDGSRRMGPRS